MICVCMTMCIIIRECKYRLLKIQNFSSRALLPSFMDAYSFGT